MRRQTTQHNRILASSVSTTPGMAHIPIMVDEVIRYLNPSADAHMVDGTIGLGGHARALLEVAPAGRLLGIDRDQQSLQLAKKNLREFGTRAIFQQGNFADLERFIPGEWRRVDAILLDLGISSWQLANRGFSFQENAPLDFRMDVSSGPSAADLVNELPETELADVLYRYGEEFRSRAIAKQIVWARKQGRIESTTELANVVAIAVRKRGRIHPATKTFQALRIVVNDELGSLERGLAAATNALSAGGRMAVITFHSLEDRIVKQYFKNQEQLLVITKRVVRPTRDEVVANPRCRSAKLRVAEKR